MPAHLKSTPACDRSFVAYSFHKPSARSSPALLSILVAFSFVFVSVLAIGASAGGHEVPDGAESAPWMSDSVYTRLSSDSTQGYWDWAGLADDEGYLDVIVSMSRSCSGNDVRSSWGASAEFEEVSGLLAPDERQSMKRTYSVALAGFSVRASLDSIFSIIDRADPAIRVYPDLPVYASLGESVSQVGADTVWTYEDDLGRSVTGEGIVVAIIDTGIDYTHPDLGGSFGPGFKVIGGYDLYYNDDDPMDDNGHGTHVAGIVAADGGIIGVAPSASLLAYKTLGPGGSGAMSDVIAAIEMAMDPNGDGDTSDHADVISMSLGGPGEPGDPVCEAVREAVNSGIVVVVAAGNEGPSLGSVASPGIAPEAITVGAVDETGTLAEFSSRGMMPDLTIKPEISAPGVDITSTVPYANAARSSITGYKSMSGTSMATPHVSGGAALLLQLHPDWSPAQVKSALVTGANIIDESVWCAGAGEMWLPESCDETLFLSDPLISYGLASGSAITQIVSSGGVAASVTVDSTDWFSLFADGTTQPAIWTNVSSVSPTNLSVAASGSASFVFQVPDPGLEAPEGYYDGAIWMDTGSDVIRIPFGFAVMSQLNVHVTDQNGNEVFDPYGGVWIYSVPDGAVAMGVRGELDPVPPASFFLPSGTYSVHAMGHQLIYTYSNPYILSGSVTIPRVATVDKTLSMADASQMTLDLETPDDQPIYVKDIRTYCRFVGTDNNISFHLTGSDYSIRGSDIFSLPHSRTIYVSSTEATVGVSISGFAYTPAMWDFITRNIDHWFEFVSSTSTDMYMEASADLQYLLAWEFDGIDASTPSALELMPGEYSVFETKYDVPGTLEAVWGDWGSHLAAGGDATFYVRRDTDTSVNSVFSGMTRTTIVQGVFSELYFPGSLFQGYSERQFYVPDYEHVLKANTVSQIYLPDRNYLTPLPTDSYSSRVGAGSIYPSLTIDNSDSTMLLYHPLLRDGSGARIGGMICPSMSLFRDGQLVGVYQLSEYLARPDAQRIVSLFGSGAYSAKIEHLPITEVYDKVWIEVGFTVPSSDADPPQMTALELPQRFVPGSQLQMTLGAVDASGAVTTEVSWRESGTSAWTALTVNQLDSASYGATIQTASDTDAMDIRIKLSDSSDNYLLYTALNASLKEIPVVFELSGTPVELGFRHADVTMVLEGQLTTLSGSPLHPTCAVPLELMVDGRKVGMILDDYVASGTHTHDGRIRYEWHFNPALLFTGPNQTIDIDVTFDLGVYQQVTRTITLTSTYYENAPPTISLISPSDGSLIAKSATIDLEVTDTDLAGVEFSLDGVPQGYLTAPWDVSTSQWSDGVHELGVVAYDEQMDFSSATYTFEIDGTAPDVTITTPADASLVPSGWQLEAEVSDAHLSYAHYSIDSGAFLMFAAPYILSLDGLAPGTHSITVEAFDAVGNAGSDTVTFEVASGSIVINLESPANGAVINSGTIISFSVLSLGTVTCFWTESGVAHDIGDVPEISTAGWSEGVHAFSITASNDLGGSYDLQVSVTIDDTPPSIVLDQPANCSYVCTTDQIKLRAVEPNFDHIHWSMWGLGFSASYPEVVVLLSNAPEDGYFTLSVEAVDMAGNTAAESFVFALDSAAPSITVLNNPILGAIRPGTNLQLEVKDRFLTSVQHSWDHEGLGSLLSPYYVSTSALTEGWHELHVLASDASGKSSWLNASYYLDATPPTVTIETFDEFVSGEGLIVEATVWDDHMVSDVILVYALDDGSFGEIRMVNNDDEYSTTVPEDLLWDGMTMFVRTYDAAGNSAESESVTVSSVPGTGDDQFVKGDERGSVLTSPEIWYLAIMCSIVIVSLTVMWSKKKSKGGIRDLAAMPDYRYRKLATVRDTVPPEEDIEPNVPDEHPTAPEVAPEPVEQPIKAREDLVILPAYVASDPAPAQEEEQERSLEDLELSMKRRYEPSIREEVDITCLEELARELNSEMPRAKDRLEGTDDEGPNVVGGLELLRALKSKD